MANFNFEKYAPEYEWWDSVFDDAKTIGALIGFDIDNIYFSGFHSQGDGACFTGRVQYRKGSGKAVRKYAPQDSELHRIADKWAELQRRNFYSISGKVSHAGYYSHSHSTSFDWEDSRNSYGWTNDGFDDDSFKTVCRDFMDWIYARLENEYEYQSAWELARAWDDLAENMREEKSAARELVAAMRAERKAGKQTSPTICGALKSQLRGYLQSWEKYRKERQAIAENFNYYESGKSLTVEQFAQNNL